jgi:hypothetical protein
VILAAYYLELGFLEFGPWGGAVYSRLAVGDHQSAPGFTYGSSIERFADKDVHSMSSSVHSQVIRPPVTIIFGR